eukprot:1158833-Pelagomonas_calceolata.AAC.3
MLKMPWDVAVDEALKKLERKLWYYLSDYGEETIWSEDEYYDELMNDTEGAAKLTGFPMRRIYLIRKNLLKMLK